MGQYKKHQWRLCCRLCEKWAGVPRRYNRAAEKRLAQKGR